MQQLSKQEVAQPDLGVLPEDTNFLSLWRQAAEFTPGIPGINSRWNGT